MSAASGGLTIDWKRFFPPATLADVSAFEDRTSIVLPPKYKSFLISENGGHSITDVSFEIPGRSVRVMLGCLYGIGDDSRLVDVENQYEDVKDDVPTGWIPIGEDPGGNQLLLITSGRNAEQIMFWDRVGFLVAADGANVFYVADDIEQFLCSLQHDSENKPPGALG